MRFLQLGNGDAQVTFGRGKGAVSEDFLDVAQVGLVLEQVRSAGVPPDMAGDALADPAHGSHQTCGVTGFPMPIARAYCLTMTWIIWLLSGRCGLREKSHNARSSRLRGENPTG